MRRRLSGNIGSLSFIFRKERIIKMEQRDFICPDCHRKHTVFADHFLPGVFGYICTSEGKTINIVDSTAEHRCSECIIKTLKELKGEKNE